MSTLRIVGEGVAWNTAASIAVKLLTLANVFLILRELSVYNYGLVQLVLSVVSTASIFLLPGLSSVLMADLAREHGTGNDAEAAALARQYFLFQAVLGALAFLVFFTGAQFLAAYLNRSDIGFYLMIMSFSFLTGPLRSFLTILTTVELRFKFQSILLVLDEALKLLLLVLAFFSLHRGIAGVLFATAFAPLAVVLVTLPWSAALIAPLWSAPRAREPWWRLVTKHRFWGIASNYLTSLNQSARVWIVQYFLGTEAVGLLSFAQGIAAQASSLITFPQIVNPIIAQATHEPERFGELSTRSLKYHLWIALAALIPGMIFAPFFIHWFFPAYTRALWPTLISLLILVPNSVNVAVTAAYNALQEQRQFFYRATLLKTFVLLIVLPPLAALGGLVGAAIEYPITIGASALERTRSLRRHVPTFLHRAREVLIFDPIDRALTHRLLSRTIFSR